MTPGTACNMQASIGCEATVTSTLWNTVLHSRRQIQGFLFRKPASRRRQILVLPLGVRVRMKRLRRLLIIQDATTDHGDPLATIKLPCHLVMQHTRNMQTQLMDPSSAVIILNMQLTRPMAAVCNLRETRAEQHDNTSREPAAARRDA